MVSKDLFNLLESYAVECGITYDEIIEVLKKSLVEAGYLYNARSQELNHVLLDPELKDIIEHTQNPNALIAFGRM